MSKDMDLVVAKIKALQKNKSDRWRKLQSLIGQICDAIYTVLNQQGRMESEGDQAWHQYEEQIKWLQRIVSPPPEAHGGVNFLVSPGPLIPELQEIQNQAEQFKSQLGCHDADSSDKLRAMEAKLASLFHLFEQYVEYSNDQIEALKRQSPNSRKNSENVSASSASARKDGQIWTFFYEGKESRIVDLKGLSYITYLLERPNQSIPAATLVSYSEQPKTETSKNMPEELGHNEHENTGFFVGNELDQGGEAADRRTLRELEKRIKEIESERLEAKQFGNWERVESLEEDLEKIATYISANYGLKGKPRTMNSHGEKVRVNVKRAIDRAIQRISEQNPKLAAYFQSTIKTGYKASYQPDPNQPVSWSVKRT